ncbi:MAG: hypothetical protein QOH12_3572 [Solirubrobacteraceae bacterium]|jgi:hypothetical protein|nr:hypothetical protein [Solirubrobacteraceae bacterium]
MAPMHQGVFAEDVLDRPSQRLAAIQDEQDRLPRVEAPLDQIGEQRARQRRVLSRAFPQPSGTFTPSVVIPSATTWTRPAISSLSSIITARRTSSSRRAISSPNAVRVFSMNTSEIVLFLVDVAVWSTCSPTGSPTRANFRVETPASIRPSPPVAAGRDQRSTRRSRPATPAPRQPSGPWDGEPARAARPASSTHPHARGASLCAPGSTSPSLRRPRTPRPPSTHARHAAQRRRSTRAAPPSLPPRVRPVLPQSPQAADSPAPARSTRPAVRIPSS